MTQNPLQSYFRQAAIHIALPSRGEFYPEGTLSVPPNGEIPIFPMTAADEMKARTPDALFNGSAIVDIVSSCAPNIIDPWQMPVIDLNALLAAIRLSSYGGEMEAGTVCPSCGHVDTFAIDLRSVLGQIQPADFSEPLKIGDLSIFFRPLTYTQLNDINRSAFFDQRTLDAVSGNGELTEEDRATQLGNAYRKIADLTMKTIAHTIASIRVPSAIVTDYQQIYEFLMNSPKATYTAIRDYGIEVRQKSDLKPIPIICNNCEHEYNQEFTLDISNFFETAS